MTIEPPILPLIATYLDFVSKAVGLFREMGVEGNLLRAWKRHRRLPWIPEPLKTNNEVIPQTGFLNEKQTITYAFHGIGCRVRFGRILVDFDFGPGGRHDCFDAWRLCGFAETMPVYQEFADIDILENHLQVMADCGQVRKVDGVIASHLYVFVDQSHCNEMSL